MFRRFSPTEETSISALESFWDSWNEGDHQEMDAAGLDSSLVATIERLHRTDDAPTARPEFSAALLERLMSAAEPMPDEVSASVSESAVAPPLPRISMPGREGSRGSRPRRSPMWAMASAGTALLVLLVVVAGFSIWHSESSREQRFAPLRTDVTEDGVVISTLLEERVAGGTLTSDPTRWIGNFKFVLEPGEYWMDDPAACQLSRQYVVGLVESGTLAMINTGPFEIQRSDGSIESIAAGVRADVNSGDSWVYFADRTETNAQKWNPGSVPLVAYQTDWSLDASCEATPGNPEWIWHQSTYGEKFDPARPVVVTFEQAFIKPGAVLSSEDAQRLGIMTGDEDIFVVNGIESGTLEAAVVPRLLETSTSVTQDPVSLQLLSPGESWSTDDNFTLRDSRERQFRSGGDDALVLTTIAWRYADSVVDSQAQAEQLNTEVTDDGVVIQRLLEEHVDSDMLSSNPDKWVASFKFVLEPGEEWQDEPSCEQSRQFVVGLVEAGALAIVGTGPVDVQRADGSNETIPAGERVDVRAGDGWSYYQEETEATVQKWNPGTEPLVAFQTDWSRDQSCQIVPANPATVWQDAVFRADFDPTRPIVATIERVTVESGAALSAVDASRLGLLSGDNDIFIVNGIDSGILESAIIRFQSNGDSNVDVDPLSVTTLGPGESRASSNDLSLFRGRERQFRNAGDEELVLTSIAWRYADSDAAASPPASTSAPARNFERSMLLEQQFDMNMGDGESESTLILVRASLSGGSVYSAPESCGMPTSQVVVIERGELSVELQSPLDITRADGTIEHVESPGSVLLETGDSFVRRNSDGIPDSAIVNESSYALAILQAMVFPRSDCNESQERLQGDVLISWSQSEHLEPGASVSGYSLKIERVTINYGSYFLETELIGFRRVGNLASKILLFIHAGTLTQTQTIGDVQQPVTIHHEAPVDLTELQGVDISAEFIRTGGEPVETTLVTLEPIESDSS